MRKLNKVIYGVTIFACIGGIYLNWSLGDDIIWPAVALIWVMNSLTNEFKKNDE
jgi:hypothetical protein